MAKRSNKPYKFVYNKKRTKVLYINENGTQHELDYMDLGNLFGKLMEMEYRLWRHTYVPYWSKWSKGKRLFFVGRLEKIEDCR